MTDDKIISTLIGIYESQKDSLDRIIRQSDPHKRLTRSAIIREAIDEWLRRYENGTPSGRPAA